MQAAKLDASHLEEQDKALSRLLGKDYAPPLPHPVSNLLERGCLCFLATATDISPHLSLMRFSYCKSLRCERDEVMILSTQRNTKKYDILKLNKNVALLVHDFVSQDRAMDSSNYTASEGGGSRYSVTLNGTVEEEEGEVAERYRSIHLAQNSQYAQFIVGEDIAIITVTLTSARVCDVNDSVRHWNKADQATAWTETK